MACISSRNKSRNLEYFIPICHLRVEGDKFIEKSVKSGLLTSIQSPTTAALHVVYRNGKPRVVSDLRCINKLNCGDFQYVYPRPHEKIRELVGRGFKYFSQLDLSGAFTQIPVDKESYPLLAFTAMTKAHSGTFAYRFLNFGHNQSNSSSRSFISCCSILHRQNLARSTNVLTSSTLNDCNCMDVR